MEKTLLEFVEGAIYRSENDGFLDEWNDVKNYSVYKLLYTIVAGVGEKIDPYVALAILGVGISLGVAYERNEGGENA